MESLQESLFDKDIVKGSEVKLGELYELSPVRHHNMVINSIHKVLNMFDEKKLKKENFTFKTNRDHDFIDLYGYHTCIAEFVDMILNIPMQDINKIFEEPYNGNKHIASTIEKYYSNGGYYAKNIYIVGRKLSAGKLIELTVYENINNSSPSSIKLTFEKR